CCWCVCPTPVLYSNMIYDRCYNNSLLPLYVCYHHVLKGLSTHTHTHTHTQCFTHLADVEDVTTGTSFGRTSSRLRSSVRSSSGVFMYFCRSNSSSCSFGISNSNLIVVDV